MRKRYKVGYTQGVFDMLHLGHLNLINSAKSFCDYLIVGINSDKLVNEYKGKKPIFNEIERSIIVSNLKSVDKCIIVKTLNKLEILKTLNFEVVFIGDDWKGSKRWIETENNLAKQNVDTIYLPYTKGISSTELRKRINYDDEAKSHK